MAGPKTEKPITMPVEIRELNIKVEVDTRPEGAVQQPAAGAGADKEAIIAEAVERILAIIRQQKER